MAHAVVLGSAAGGGFPQWNSNAPACRRARRGDAAARARSQASLAVSANDRDWVVLNASPDLRSQIEATSWLQPREGLRSSPIAGVVLTGGDVDAIAGLLHLRERIELAGASGACGLAVVAFAVPGKVPLYLETTGQDPGLSEEGDAVGLEIIETTTGKSLFFIPGCAAMTDELRRRLASSALVFFDGTLWRDDEMIRLGVGSKTGRRMGHMSMSGEDGTIAAFRNLGVGRRIFIHINNSNPALLDDSPERRIANAAGWEIAYDGMEVTL